MITFHHQTTIPIAGPTQTDKTFKKILQHRLIHVSHSRLIYVKSEHAAVLADLKHLFGTIEYVQGMKSFPYLLHRIEADELKLVVLDDQISETGKLETCILFTKGSHHPKISVLYIVHNAFDKGKVDRTITLNSHYMVLLNNPRD